jgi:hypothetical protein
MIIVVTIWDRAIATNPLCREDYLHESDHQGEVDE